MVYEDDYPERSKAGQVLQVPEFSIEYYKSYLVVVHVMCVVVVHVMCVLRSLWDVELESCESSGKSLTLQWLRSSFLELRFWLLFAVDVGL